ncbi:hypothetical protein [Pedobacter terrae]
MKTFKGKLVITVQSTEQAGKLNLSVSAKGLKAAVLPIETR